MHPQGSGAAAANGGGDGDGPAPGTTWFCAGIPFVRRRALSFDETATLERWVSELGKASKRRASVATATLLALGASFASHYVFGLVVLPPLLLLALIFLGMTLYSWSMRRRYARALATGQVLEFAGRVPEHGNGAVDEYHRRLARWRGARWFCTLLIDRR